MILACNALMAPGVYSDDDNSCLFPYQCLMNLFALLSIQGPQVIVRFNEVVFLLLIQQYEN